MSNNQAKILHKERVWDLVGALLSQAEVIAPKRENGEDVYHAVIKDPAEIELDYGNTILPLKTFFLPQTEPLFSFSLDDGVRVEPIYDETKRIFFAVRSCDVTATNYQDRFFSREFEDIYYLKRRENSTLISLACLEPCEYGFCVCCEGGPSLTNGYDLQLTDMGDRYLVEIGSEKGERIVEDNGALFSDASDEDVQRKAQVLEGVDQKFTRATYVAYAIRKITRQEIADQRWEALSDRCFSCSGCRYVCPTCSCFDVLDVETEEGGIRQRTWDSCSLAGFTRMVSGENPRAEPTDRFRRFFYHKLNFFDIQKDGRHGCVGCGRCFMACLGTTDMWRVVNKLRETEELL